MICSWAIADADNVNIRLRPTVTTKLRIGLTTYLRLFVRAQPASEAFGGSVGQAIPADG